MDFGVTGKLGGYYLAEQYQKNGAANKNGGVSFAELAAVKAVGKSDVSGMSFKEMWQARYPGAYYHVMDGSVSCDRWRWKYIRAYGRRTAPVRCGAGGKEEKA